MSPSSTDHTAATKLLEKALPNRVFTDKDSLFKASFDNTRLSFLPAAVVKPDSEDDIGTLLSLANKHKVPVVTRGAGTATTGATTPYLGGWVLDLSDWDNIHIDEVSGLAYVQPGAKVADIRAAAEAQGWMYPPDPSSLKYATIGGTIATNAGGMSGAKYGVTRDYIYALEGFLPTGEWTRWGMDLKKYVSGYNIKDLWIGSEGTLGVITGAVLKLVPRPETRWTALALYPDEHAALEAVQNLLQQRIVPSILEFLDRQSVTCALSAWKNQKPDDQHPLKPHPFVFLSEELRASMDGNAPAALLLELDGTTESLAKEKAQVLAWARDADVFYEAKNTTEAESLWQVRRQCSPAMFQMGDTKLNEDVVVPLRSQIELLDYTLTLKEETGLATPTFGHAADGNFHVHIMYNREDKEQAAKAEIAVGKVMEKVIALGGAITGEHGIGLAKTPFLKLQHSAAEIAAMKAVKKAFDPNNILNPGKIFDEVRVWEHTPVKVRMPWDH